VSNNKEKMIVAIAFVATTVAVLIFSNSIAKAQNLGDTISKFTEDIISGANQQVQNTLESAGQQALPQLQENASQYDCLIIVMNFGKAHGAMTCSPGEQFSQAVGVNSGNAPSGSSSNVFQSQSQSQDGSARSSIQREGNSALMQNQITGSGSSSNVIPGDVG
jgi:uncharacterized protein YbjQ (UPF0145 family)